MLWMEVQILVRYFMDERKKCISCNKFLIAYSGLYLHPETPCAGLLDYVYIEAQIEDEFLHEKFEMLYGKPEINDYERIGLLEEENDRMSKQLLLQNQKIIEWQQISNTPLLKFLMKLLRINPPF